MEDTDLLDNKNQFGSMLSIINNLILLIVSIVDGILLVVLRILDIL